jgi:glycosyltransferase involved in cell wall biosynthesis
MADYSVLILTLNEEINLPRCLASVSTCDDVVVLDSGSTDRTADIAQSAGARLFVRRFDTFAGQRNYAQRDIPFHHRWVFHLDADEMFTPELARDCAAAAKQADCDGYYVAPKMLWTGQWIPHCTDFPAWQARFVRAPEFQFIDVGHGQREAPHMRMQRLTANYLHDLSAGGENEWLDKHRRYARAEARQFFANRGTLHWRDIMSANRLLRRRALKHFSYRLPLRPAARFVYQYLLRRGFLDGRVGLHYCRLLARYEGFATEALRELKAQQH